MSEKLRPCPFCGSSDVGYSEHIGAVTCGWCGIIGPTNFRRYKTKAATREIGEDRRYIKAVAAWNARVHPAIEDLVTR